MKKTLFALSILSILAITSCDNSGGGHKKDDPESKEYEINFRATMAVTEEFDVSYTFEKTYLSFDKPGTEFNKELAIVSFASIVHSDDKTLIKSFYNDFKFDNIVTSEDYDKEETKDSIKFTLAHKHYSDYEVVAINLNGINYGEPWINNFVLGNEGNAEGFQIAADKVLTSVNTYLESYKDNNYKVWLTGYSRGAGIANIVGYTLLEGSSYNLAEENMYSYTFEAPKCVDVKNVKQHNSIHNIINSADLVTYVAPTEYGLSRVCVDHDIYSKYMDSRIKNFDSRLKLAAFTKDSDSKYSNESEFIQYLFSLMLKKLSDDSIDMSTRAHYVTNYQEHISYLIYIVRNLKSETLTDIMEEFSKLSTNPWAMIGLMADDGLYNFLKPILDKHNEKYDPTKLRNACNKFVKLGVNSGVILLAANEDIRNNLARCVLCHTPEIELAMLLEADL